MNTFFQITGLLGQLIPPLSYLVGLGIAARFVRLVLPIFQADALDEDDEPVPAPHGLLVVLWLALGGLFAAPFISLWLIFSSGSSLIIALRIAAQQGLASIAQGLVLTAANFLVILLTYVYVVWAGRKAQKEGRLPFMERSALDSGDWLWICLGLGGLVSSLVSGIVMRLALLSQTLLAARMGSETTSFLAGFLLGLAVLGVAVYALNNGLLTYEEEGLEEEALEGETQKGLESES